MGEARVPCACEADVYGALTQLILLQAAQAPVFLTDLVDMDVADNTGVVWHCGQAPMSMRDPEVPAEATIHTNRKQPLLYQFTLKPGPVTFLRISQAHGQPHMVLGYGEMLRAADGLHRHLRAWSGSRVAQARCSMTSSPAGSNITWRWPTATTATPCAASPGRSGFRFWSCDT